MWIGLRYLRARRENRFVGFISGIAMTGIALGVATLIAVLSVMNGFERDLQAGSSTSSRTRHSRATAAGWPTGGRSALRTGDQPGVVAVAPFIEGRGMLVAGERSAAVELRAVLPDDGAPGDRDRTAPLGPRPRRTRAGQDGASCSDAGWLKNWASPRAIRCRSSSRRAT